jgi:hypothetical protein
MVTDSVDVVPLFEIERATHAKLSAPNPSPRENERIPPLKSPFGRRHCKPLHASPAPDADISEFIDGAASLGFVPSVHQERFARQMNATHPDGRPLYRRIAKTEPRRSGKTEGLWALIIGRCKNRADYHAAFSAQSGKMGRKRFLAMAVKLERWDPCARPSRSNPDGCQREHVHYRVYRSNGGERIEWSNGATLDVNPPDPESYRGDEYDLIVADEAQEMDDDEQADEFLGGINPTMDTIPTAQLVVAGTAGKKRSGLLWSSLEKGRHGAWGILEYAAPDHADPTDEATWLAAHPGIGTLTTLEVIRENFTDLSLLDFQREYLGQWPADLTTSAIDAEHWARALAEMGTRPTRVGLAFDVSPDNTVASLACAWRDADGIAHVELLAHRAGTTWLPAEAARVAAAAKVPVAYDTVGKNIAPADTLGRRRPPVRLTPMGIKDVQGAAQRIVSALADGTVRHFGQKDLDLAVQGAAWRALGESGRAFGHKASANPITPLTAAALALWAYDRQPVRRRTGVRAA